MSAMSSGPSVEKSKFFNMFDRLNTRRNSVANSVMHFRFNNKRVKVLTDANEVLEDCNGIVYWMFRDGRVQDNWAFLFAQKLAFKNHVPLHVCYCIVRKFLDATLRHYKFLVKSLEEVANDCKELNINFHLLHGDPTVVVPDFIKKHNMGALVIDFLPLRISMNWADSLKKNLPSNIPICQVDAHNIVPCWITSDTDDYLPHMFKKKLYGKLDEYLTEFPPLVNHPYDSKFKIPKINWKNCLKNVEMDRTVDEVEWCKPGYRAALIRLQDFIATRLVNYHIKLEDSYTDAGSGLSPWFNFGMISVQRVILELQEFEGKYKQSLESFREQAVVLREMCDNFCYYNRNYDKVSGCHPWATKSLDGHRDDKRAHEYSLEDFEESQTHDDLWNAAQNQLRETGKMHNYVRMFWAKKILEWTKTPEEALAWSIYLNNKYSMDARDPTGYVGCMTAICGIHDHPWIEREVYGKVRYRNHKGCKRKFDVDKFIRKYNGEVVNKKIIKSPKRIRRKKDDAE